MQIDERTIGEVVVLDLHGRMTVSESDRLIRDTVQGLVTRGARKLVLNFADVPYMDSVGVSTLVRLRLLLSQDDGRLKLLKLPRRIADLLAITGLTAAFEVFDEESDAIRSFDRPDGQVSGQG